MRRLVISLATISLLLAACNLFVKKDIDCVPKGTRIIEMDKAKIVLDDGDSFTYDGTGIRVLAMDTPEIAHPEHGFLEDQEFGREAAAYTAKIFADAKVISYIPDQPDRYGRTLAHVFIDGDLLAIKLIKAGLAHETVSHYGDNGFPELARRILEAAKESKAKDFMPPFQWRREHRVNTGIQSDSLRE